MDFQSLAFWLYTYLDLLPVMNAIGLVTSLIRGHSQFVLVLYNCVNWFQSIVLKNIFMVVNFYILLWLQWILLNCIIYIKKIDLFQFSISIMISIVILFYAKCQKFSKCCFETNKRCVFFLWWKRFFEIPFNLSIAWNGDQAEKFQFYFLIDLYIYLTYVLFLVIYKRKFWMFL